MTSQYGDYDRDRRCRRTKYELDGTAACIRPLRLDARTYSRRFWLPFDTVKQEYFKVSEDATEARDPANPPLRPCRWVNIGQCQ
jgi:hypothetical protein